MRRCTLVVIILLTIFVNSNARQNGWKGRSTDIGHGKLKISENRRFIVFDDGTPFFYLGDTAWELFHRLNKKETEKYLENRREKGFTVIQAVALSELDGLNTPNAEGNKPLFENNPLKPNENYFDHVDWVIKKAGEKGIFIGLLPTWGDKVDQQWGIGPVIFNRENGFEYGKWIGNRYKDFPNIIWINGGDRTGGGKNKEIWDAIGHGIKSVDKNHLMTFHPNGEMSSSDWFQESDWLDFDMCQTGHAQRSYSIYKQILVRDYNLKPVKPIFDGEPRYEDHPINWKPEQLGWFDDTDVRQALYWDLFSGAFGHTYGCHPIWQMLDTSRAAVGFARHNWTDVLNLPGASELIYARKLIESRPFTSRIPDQSLIFQAGFSEKDYVSSTRGDGYAMIYIPTGGNVTVDPEKIGAKTLKVWWFDPRNGSARPNGTIEGTGKKDFSTPTNGRGNDWILILDDVSKNFKAPGQ